MNAIKTSLVTLMCLKFTYGPTDNDIPNLFFLFLHASAPAMVLGRKQWFSSE